MFYTNRSAITKTFHGITFRPGETKEVFQIINDPTFVPSNMRKEPPTRDRSTALESVVEEPLVVIDAAPVEETIVVEETPVVVESVKPRRGRRPSKSAQTTSQSDSDTSKT